ncbi:WD40 repeat-like protein [Dendrothele bispora CBS 962.96]|uniref:DNA damage-binding protein CMR1 n=1 Tax=Dendrothele bispora (strain CBS 962.96) TaxID=1314807 RepID=A0A4S8LK73_DENBC|nr:WD40 repeat-like protein [Dendrothele bispora CBS 962.96]
MSKAEREREANIARNRALLEQLELKQAVQDLGFSAKPKPATSKAKPIQPTKRVKKEKAEVEPPRRQSARLRNVIDPSESPSKKRKREAEIEEQRAQEAEARIEAEERARIAKRPRHEDLDLKNLIDEEDASELPSLSTELQSIAQTSWSTNLPEDPELFVYDDSKKDERAVVDLRKRLKGLKIVSRAKVTQDRVYSAAYHPEPTKDLIFFGDKHGQLGVWDARATKEEAGDDDDAIEADENQEGGKYWRLQVHWPATSKSSISCIKFDPLDSHTVYTTSYDCTIRSLAFESGVSREIFSSEDILLCSMDFAPAGNELWISDASGGLTHLDLREDKSKAKWYQLSDQKIGCVSVNPTRSNFLLTASNNRSLKIWDVRKLGTMPSNISSTPSASSATPTLDFDFEVVKEFLDSPKGSGCLRGEWRHEKSASSAYWDPRGRSIVSTSYDDSIRLWDYPSSVFKSDEPFPSVRPFQRIRHNCQTGKWLTILRAQWSSNPEVYPHFTIGNMDHSLDIFSGKGELITKLADRSKITAVQAVTCTHPSIVERVASGNASGRCVLWAPTDD